MINSSARFWFLYALALLFFLILSVQFANAQENNATGNGIEPKSKIDSNGSSAGSAPDNANAGDSESESTQDNETTGTDSQQPADSLKDDMGRGPVFQEDFAPQNLQESEIDKYSPWRGVVAAAFVLALLFFAVWILKKVTKPGFDFAVNRRMRVLETLTLGLGRQVILVQVGDRILIIGSTQNGLTLLDSITAGELKELTKSGFEHIDEGTLEALPSVSKEGEGDERFSDKLEEIRNRLNAVKSNDD